MKTTKELIPDAEANDRSYYAVLRDSEWRVVANCQHRHATRKAAEACAVKITKRT